MPLHVTDTPHGLELRMAGAKLVEVPEVALLQQVLAATVSRELVTHPAGGTKRKQVSKGLILCICDTSTDLHSRSAADNDAAHSVGEAVGEQAGNVVIHDLHLAALELADLVQADLVLLRVLEEGEHKGEV